MRNTVVIEQIPSFDPNPSLKAALDFLKETGIQNFALIARIATWVFLPTDRQQFTKDVDLIVLKKDSAKNNSRDRRYLHLKLAKFRGAR